MDTSLGQLRHSGSLCLQWTLDVSIDMILNSTLPFFGYTLEKNTICSLVTWKKIIITIFISFKHSGSSFFSNFEYAAARKCGDVLDLIIAKYHGSPHSFSSSMV